MDYQVNIDIDSASLDKLHPDYYLFGFKAVRTSQSATPVVWFKTDRYKGTTEVPWTTQYEAYDSDPVKAGQVIKSYNRFPINPGKRLVILDKYGKGRVDDGMEAGKIQIENTTQEEFTVGISQQAELTPKYSPLCAIPAYGGNLVEVAPVEIVMLTFATNPIHAGTVIFQSFSSSLLIDMTNASDGTRYVSYDINKQWSGWNPNWSKVIKAGDSIVNELIKS